MPETTITVVDKKNPEPGRKRGRIISTDGKSFQADMSIVNAMVTQFTYNITYKDDEFKNAKFRVIESFEPTTGSPNTVPASPKTGVPHGYSTAYREPQQTPDTRAFRDEEIGVYAMMKCLPPEYIKQEGFFKVMKGCAQRLREFRQWQRTGNVESGPQKPTMKEEMDDDIPESFR